MLYIIPIYFYKLPKPALRHFGHRHQHRQWHGNVTEYSTQPSLHPGGRVGKRSLRVGENEGLIEKAM